MNYTIDYTRLKYSEKIRDHGMERGFSNEPKTGKSRMLGEIDLVLAIDDAGSCKFATVVISEKPIDGRVGLELSKSRKNSGDCFGVLVYEGVTFYWHRVEGDKFPETNIPILMDSTVNSHITLGVNDGLDRKRNVPTSKEHQPYSYLATLYPNRVNTQKGKKKPSNDHVVSALAKYLAARFWPGVVLQKAKTSNGNDLPVTIESFNTTDSKIITNILWRADNLNFKNVKSAIEEYAMSIIDQHEELSKAIRLVETKLFVKQMSTVFVALMAMFRINPNIPKAYLGQATTAERRLLNKGEKIFSGYLNRSLTKHGFRAEIASALLIRDGIKGADKYNGNGKGFDCPQDVRDREQYAHYLWGEFLTLARNSAFNSDANVYDYVKQASQIL